MGVIFVFCFMSSWRSYLCLCLLCLGFGVKDSDAQAGRPRGEELRVQDMGDTARIVQLIGRAKQLEAVSGDSALAVYRAVLEQSLAAGYTFGIATGWVFTGKIYERGGFFDKSMAAFRSAIPYCAGSERAKVYLADIYNGIANALRRQGAYEKAVRYYLQAILFDRRYPAAAGTRVLSIYNNMATVLLQLNNPGRVLFYLDKSEAWARQRRDTSLLGAVLLNKGVLYGQQEAWEQSLSYLHAGLELGRRSHLPQYEYNALVNIGEVYLLRKQPAQALSYLLEAQAFPQPVMPYTRVIATGELGRTYYELGDYRRAERLLLEAWRGARQRQLTDADMNISRRLGDLYRKTGRYRQAMDFQDRYMQLKDSIENRKTAAHIHDLDLRYRTAEKDNELIRKQLLINTQQHQLRIKNMWIAAISVGLLLLGGMLAGFYRSGRHRSRLLQLKAMMAGEEQERVRIARELHDGIGGMLAAIRMHIGTMSRKQAGGADKDLGEVMDMLQDTVLEVRKTAHNLMPDNIEKHSLPEALRMYCYSINSSSLQIDLQLYGRLDDLEQPLALTLYRIVQELIQNIIKHAAATYAVVRIREHERVISIMVEDNGCGFDSRKAMTGLGLRNVQARVQAWNGHLSVESTPGNGTIVYVEIALKDVH